MELEEAYQFADKINAPAIYLRDNVQLQIDLLDSCIREVRHVESILTRMSEHLKDAPSVVHDAGIGSANHSSDGFVNLSEDRLEEMRANTIKRIEDYEDGIPKVLDTTISGNIENYLIPSLKSVSNSIKELFNESLDLIR